MESSIFNNVILVSGSGRNCGKTTFVCQIIEQLSVLQNVIGLKISPHVHIQDNKQELLVGNEYFNIYREKDMNSGKDSARMLIAGANEVYFIECTDENLPYVESHLRTLIPKNVPVVCESGSFSNYYKPGYHIHIVPNENIIAKASSLKNQNKANCIISKKDFSINETLFKVDFSEETWDLRFIGE